MEKIKMTAVERQSEIRKLSEEVLFERLKQLKEQGYKGSCTDSEIELLRLGLGRQK